MINYDSKHWMSLLLSFRGTVLPAILPRLALLTLFTVSIAACNEWFDKLMPLNQVGHTLLAVVVGFPIVLRTGTAYARYWEGRKLWGGLVTSSRNLLCQAGSSASPIDDLASLVAAYAKALKQHLRGDRDL